MNIFFIGVVVSILVYIVVGIWAGRSVKDVNDYYVSGRNAPTILIAGTLFASMLSVNGFMGDQGWCYSGNITTLVLLNSMCAMGYIAGPLMFGRYLRRSECTTMPEYFGARYCDLKNRRVARNYYSSFPHSVFALMYHRSWNFNAGTDRAFL